MFLILPVLLAQNAALQKQVATLRHQATTDQLTGLLNRHSFDRRINEVAGTETWVYCDLCKFKQINDTYGHSEGDRIIAAVGQAIRAEVDQAYRVGGDEFVIVLQAGQDEAAKIMHRIEQRLALLTVGGDPVVMAWGVGDDLDSAEGAMYRHKDQCHGVMRG